MKIKTTSAVTVVAALLLLCVSDVFARKKKNRKQLPSSPQWKSGSDPGKDERFASENEGNSIKLDCRAKGKPTPKVTWYKNGQEIGPDNDRVEINKFKLTIPSLGAEDKGNYTCIVRNTEGQLDWTFYVDVIVRIWPLEVEGPQNMTVTEGETVRFRCRVLNDPDATIRWLKPEPLGFYAGASSPLSPSSYGTKPEFLDNLDNPEVLELNDVTENDAGEYRCLAGNVWGLKYSSAFLVVEKPTTTTESTTTTPTTTTTTTEAPTTTKVYSTFPPFNFPNTNSPYFPVHTFGPDLYETTRAPRQNKKDRKDRKDRNNRRKNGRRRKPPKNRKNKGRGEALTTTASPFFIADSSTTTSAYKPFTTIWNFDNGVYDYTDPELTDNADPIEEGDYKESTGEENEGVSLWTIYTIVGAIAGVILLIGLLAITIAVCCRKDGEPVYKSTPV